MDQSTIITDLDNVSSLLGLNIPGIYLAIIIAMVLTLPLIVLVQTSSNYMRIYVLIIVFAEFFLYTKLKAFFQGSARNISETCSN